MAPPIAWLDEWPVAYPCRRGPWTVSDGTRWAIIDPDPAGHADHRNHRRPTPVTPDDDPALVGLGAALATGQLVSYRHHRRAVVRTETGYIKVTVPGKIEATRQRHLLMTELGVRSPALEACHPDGRIEIDTVPGRSLYELLIGSAVAPGHPAVVADVMVELHRHRPTGLPAYDATPGWIETTARADPELALKLQRIFDSLPAAPAGGDNLIHGDLHDKNVLLHPNGTVPSGTEPWESSDSASGTLIDLDGLAIGDPAIDVGNLCAHLTLRSLQGYSSQSEAEVFRRQLIARYRLHRDIDLDVVRIVERHTWLRLAALYHFRRSGHHLVPLLLRLAADDHWPG